MSISVDAARTSCAKNAERWVLAATILGSSLAFIDGTVINIALPVIQDDFKADFASVQWVVESYALMLSALVLVGGSLGDRYGRRRIFSLGTGVFALSSGLCSISQSSTTLIFARTVQGVGAAMLIPGSLAIISASFKKNDRGRAIGTWSGFTAIAAGAGPVVGGWLIQNLSWHWIFLINLPIALFVLVITWRHVPESRDENAARLDLLGAVTVTLGLGGLVYGLIESGNRGFRDLSVITALVLGVALLPVFLVIERRKGMRAMMPLELFRSRTFFGTNVLTFFLYAALSGVMFFLPFDLIQIQGYSATEAGASLVPFVVTMFALSRWAGGLVTRYGAKLPLTVGPIVAAVGFAMFVYPGGSAGSYWLSFFPAVIVMSLGMVISVAPLSTTVMSSVDEGHAGVASGVNNAVARCAGLIAIAVLGLAMTAVFTKTFTGNISQIDLSAETRSVLAEQTSLDAVGRVDVPPEHKQSIEQAARSAFVDGFRVVMLSAAVLGFIGALAAYFLVETRSTKRRLV